MCLNQQCIDVSSVGATDCGNCSMHGVSCLQLFMEEFVAEKPRVASYYSEMLLGKRSHATK